MTTLIHPLTKELAATRVEIELLLCCSRTCIASETAEQIKILFQQHIDWNYLLETAAQHGVIPLLYQNFKNIYPETVPQNIHKQLREYFHTNAINNLYRTQELHNLLNLFEKNQIPAISFKGPVLAALAYGSLALRQFADLDILIHKQDAIKVRELLISQNYHLIVEQLSNATDAEEAIYLQSACEYNFLKNDGRVAVEPHWGFAKRKLCISFNPDPLWQRLIEVSLVDKTVRTFSVEDSLLVTCINGAKDYWNSLKTICDVTELIRAHQDIDWDAVIEQARIIGCQRILFLGLFLAHEMLGAALPERVWQNIQTDAAIKPLAHEVRQRLFTNVAQTPKHFGDNFSIWDIKVRERLRDKLWYCFNLVFSPNEGDAAFLPLPQYLHFMYPLVRQFRLLGRLTRLI
ncbi:hypothetical protein A6770_37710 [Nostoc minutum NIES-26]|uniref:Nucleotidyltransferase n=1 Tax=Nostoc minutum NIES-26 TaxID=1844469 RepID=A0A367RY00_9NOSO|nr:hypothetical protein A6770_37710 [Nostoc minutum NIES-26]